jgi:uncharacterized membrane protein YphA (DoxX/SURF4 family)
MRTNPFYDAWLFLIGATSDQEALGAWRYVFVVLFVVLLVASVLIAARNWKEDPRQRTGTHLAVWFVRTLIGCMWFQAVLWKMPLFSPDNGLHYWTQQMAQDAAFQFYRDFVSNVLLPYFNVLNLFVFLVEFALAVSLMLGLGVRLVALAAVPYVLGLWLGLYRDGGEWPWNYIFLAALMGALGLSAAGRSLGLDALLRRHRPEVRESYGPVGKLLQLVT